MIDQLLHPGLGLGRERDPHEQLGDGLADVRRHGADDALPAGLLLLLAAEDAAVEREVLVLEGRRQGGRARPDQVPAQDVAQGLERRVAQGRVQRP